MSLQLRVYATLEPRSALETRRTVYLARPKGHLVSLH